MIGIWNTYTNMYLYVLGVAMLAGFGFPLLFVPIRWARVFRWEIPQHLDLTAFLGRSVGVIIFVLSIFAFRVANNPTEQPLVFDMLLWVISGSILIHIYGAIRNAQPITETIEIIMWFLLLFATLAFYPT